MTDFGAKVGKRRKNKAQSRWQDIIAILITVLLVLFIGAGFLRGIKIKGSFSNSVWDGSAPLAIAVDSSPASLIVVQKEPRRILVLKLDDSLGYATGDAQKPVGSVGEGFKADSTGGRKFLSNLLGVNVPAYLELKNPANIEKKDAEQMFKDFAFFMTPIPIVFNGLDGQIKDTNLSRVDLLRLWSLIKGTSIDEVNFEDANNFANDVIGPDESQFRGIDRDLIRKSLAKYFEDYRLVGRDVEVSINNASGENGLGALASDMAQIAGYDVSDVATSNLGQSKSQVEIVGNSSGASYLAKMFNCGIVPLQNDSQESKITLVLGRDFAENY